ncbi:MAG: flagellin FliC [Myxococcales bacterium]|nr:flagellin FliC [Myxococcales bacterium]
MALTVRTNLASMNSISQLNMTNGKLGRNLARISSGMRINSARDDAAGLGVAENLDTAKRSLMVAMRNTNDGIAVIQTAESATAEVSNIIKRMRELAVQSASDTLDDVERSFIQDEFLALTTEVDRIANVTNFNGVQLSDGSTASIDVQVGINNVAANDRITLALADLTAATVGVDTGTIDLSTAGNAQSALAALDTALDVVNSYRSVYGATQNRLESSLRNLDSYVQNLAMAESQIRDADYAVESAQLTKFQVMQQAGVAVLAQAKNINAQAAQLLQ